MCSFSQGYKNLFHELAGIAALLQIWALGQ